MITRPKNMDEVRNWTDSQILEYLKEYWENPELTFDAYADEKPIRTTNTQKFIGSISQLKSNGKSIKYPILDSQIFYNVPSNLMRYFKLGQCNVIFELAKREFREQIGNMFLLNPILSSFKVTGAIIPKIADDSDVVTLKKNWKLKDDMFIGLFSINSNGSYTISDIRRSDFSLLILPNGKKQSEFSFSPKQGFKLIDNTYYEFGWLLKQIKPNFDFIFEVNESIKLNLITSQSLINRLHDDIIAYPAGAGQKIVKMLDTLKNQLTASGKEIFIYELLQNANDYPNGKDKMVDVEFYITKDYLIFQHTGSKFNEKNISAICNINAKEKTDNVDTIGYKGIGFKTVFLDNNYVYLKTGGFSFRFDQSYTQNMVDTPYQILPVWTDFEKINLDVKTIFKKSSKDFRVQFALRPISRNTLRYSNQNFVNLFSDVFQNERVILFIPHISCVKVYHSNSEIPDIVRAKDTDTWQVDSFVEEISDEMRESINSEIERQEEDGTFKIPTKYYNFQKTAVSFACQKDGVNLIKVKDANLYCYLPTKATWGFEFLMNTDMIPTGPRDDIEMDININAEIAEIAGGKFFDWLKDLCELKKFKVNSIFSLIPVFETNISQHKKYKDLIERFKSGFDARVEADELIPVDSNRYELVKNIILDETGLMTSGIMDDKDFFKITGYQGALPVKVLRNDREFKAFLRRYLKELNSDNNIWDFEDLKKLCSDPDFKEWVSIQNNNNLFLEFLLKKEKLEDFIEEDIFIQQGTSSLRNANDLYYDVDEHLIDLKAFDEHIPHLSISTREFFKGNKDWNNVVETEFSEFIPEDFVNDKLLSVNEFKSTSQKLHIKETSLSFYKFLAKNEIKVTDDIKSLPFFNDNNEPIDGFEDSILFFSSKHGHEVASYDWLTNVIIEFVSSDYEKIVLEYFRNNLNVQDFTDEITIKNIILNEDYHDDIVIAFGEDFEISKGFIGYCYIHKDMFNSGDLRNYTLKVFDGDGDTSWCLSEDHVFFSSSIYDDYSVKEWIDYDWMYVLDKDYYTDQKDLTDYKKFLSQKFWITELEEKNFYKDVVKKNLKKIISNTNGSNDSDGHKNVDFIKYLDDNYHLIFEEEKDADVFVGLNLVDKDTSDVDANTENLYIYDDELVSIVENDWFPKDLVSICNSQYENSRALLAIGVKKYKFGSFFDDIIIEELGLINENIDIKSNNIDFHNFVIDHLNVLTPDQQSKMLNAKVFLYGQDIASTTAGGHKTLSSKAKELFDKGLVEFSDLDIIDPDYKTEDNVEYWEARLVNTKFTITHFFVWLKDNVDTFSGTLQDEKLNIEFWRWLKDNVADKLIDEVPCLPVLLKDGSIDSSNAPVYFPDEYMEGAGIEHLVNMFNKNALFISPIYIDEDDSIKDWKIFWEKIGVKHEIVDILVETVIPRLSEIEEENLPRLLAENREKLESYYENELVSKLRNLSVKAQDGKFYGIIDTIYIDCEKLEPFPYIVLPNQISYNSAEERRLIKDLIDEIAGNCVSTLSEWQQRKLDCYLVMQTKDVESIRGIHYRFINDLSIIRNTDRGILKDIERIEEIYLLNRNNEFCEASILTMGSVYNPFFDFEGCGVNSLDYVSDSYITECTEYPGKLFREINVHSDFQKEDISLLTDRVCSIYFWNKYLTKKDASIQRIQRIKQFISDKLFNDLACIPTKDFMKTPKGLYFGDEVSRYVKAIEDWENKIPLKDLPEIKTSDNSSLFGDLPFKDSLDFLDALYALISIPGQERRTQLLEWMIECYDETFDAKIIEYREDEHALWFNNMNGKVHIKELYTLDYYDKTLEQYFSANHRIANKQYFPAGDLFRKACDILKIKTITAQDLKMIPVDESTYKDRDSDLKLFALVIAGIADIDNWKSLYEGYCEKLSVLTLHNCSSILITYNKDDSINQSLWKFYHQDGSNDFYFVKSLDNKRVYTLFVSEYMKFLNITKDDVAQELVEDIMDSRENALEIIKEQNTLMLDDDFKNELEKLCPGIKRYLSGKEAEDDNEEETPYRPTFTTNSDKNDSEDYSEDDENENTIFENDANVEMSQEDNTDEDSDELDVTHVYQDSADKTDASTPSSSIYKEDTIYETDRNSNHAGAGNDYNSKKPRETVSDDYNYDTSDEDEYIGSVDKNSDYQPLGSIPRAPRTRKAPKPFTKEELNRLRSNGSPLELESLPATEDEINVLAQYGISPEQIADTNYLAQLRLYMNLTREMNEEPLEELEDFIKNANDVSTHALKSGRYIHACSAARGVMYASPSLWNKMIDDKWAICVYLDGRGKNFHYINSADEFLKLVAKDDVVIKITGKDKVDIVNKLYSGLLGGEKGSAYTLIRVAARTNMDAVFAHYIGSMAEKEDGNEDLNEF